MCANDSIQGFALYTGTLPFSKCRYATSCVLENAWPFISKLTGLSFVLERIGPLAATIISAFYLLVFYLSAVSKTPKNLSASVYSESLTKTACQHLLLLIGFDTLIYRKYYDTPPGHAYMWCGRLGARL